MLAEGGLEPLWLFRVKRFSEPLHSRLGNLVASVFKPGGPDVIKFDSGLERVYVTCSSEAISIFQMNDPAHYRKLGHFPVQKRVRSLAVDRETHSVYAPEQEADGRAVASSTEEPAHGCTIAAPDLPAA